MKKLIGYCRVSTKEQGESRNGLEAQRAEIERFAAYNGYHLLEVVEEVASGSLGLEYRPILSEVVDRARKLKAKIVVSKVDRVSRDAGLIRKLMHDTRQVIAIDVGEQADSFVEHIYAGLAEKERKMIGARTKAGLQAAKARGVILGNRKNLPEARAKATSVIKANAVAFALKMKPLIERMRKADMTLIEIAEELNMHKIATARGGRWQASTVHNIIKRWEN